MSSTSQSNYPAYDPKAPTHRIYIAISVLGKVGDAAEVVCVPPAFALCRSSRFCLYPTFSPRELAEPIGAFPGQLLI